MSTQVRPNKRSRSWSRGRWLPVWAAPMLVLVAEGTVHAQQDLEDTRPNGAGLPGREFLVQLLGWGMWLGIAACIGAVIYGGATWMGFGASSAHRAVSGKAYVVGGLIGAAAIGLAPTAVNMVLRAAQ